MIIDGHAHACGFYHDTQSIINFLSNHQINKVILCPGEPNSFKNYSLPMFSNLFHSSNLGYTFNRIISFVVNIKCVAKHIDEQNMIVGNMAKQYPQEIIQAYLVNPLDDCYFEKMEMNFKIFNFRMIKLHQCWNKFDVLSENFVKTIQWATNMKLPIFIHLLSKNQSVKFANLTNEYINTTFIIAHMIGFEEIVERSKSPNIYFDISAPQLISKKRILDAIKIVGSSKLILGSDAPYGTDNIKINLKLISQLPILEQEKQNITGKNIAQILNIL
jgi:predicted TIM-barrel fold metal-dependent hydrolase